MAAAYTKAFTGLTGMKVAKNPTHILGVLYRKHTEAIINDRAAIIKNSSTIEEAEKKIGMGQIEEVIIQAENELKLSRSILEWKAWEPLCETAPASQWKWPI